MKGSITIDFLEKGTTVNSISYGQLLRQNSLYLLNVPLIYIYIYIYNWFSACANTGDQYFTIDGLVWFGFMAYQPLCFYNYIKYIWFVKAFCRYTQLNDQTVLFSRIQFRKSQQS